MMNSRHRLSIRKRFRHFRRNQKNNRTPIQIINVHASDHRIEPEHDRRNIRLINVFKDFSANTSLHGIKYIAEDERSLIERILWCVMVIGSFCLCVHLVAQVWYKRVNNPIIVTFDDKLTPIGEVPFPAVTICPVDQADTTVLNFSNICETHHFNSTFEKHLFDFYSVICEQKCNINGSEPNKFANYFLLGELYLILLPARVSMEQCVLFEVPRNCEKLFNDVMIGHGKCFTFNSLSGEDIYSSGSFDEFRKNRNENTNIWSIDRGYSKIIHTSMRNVYPIMGRASPRPLMELTLKNSQILKDIRCSGLHEGFLIAIHPPNIVPRRTDFMQAPYESVTKFNVKPAVMTTDVSLKNYEPEKRQCYFSYERMLRFYQNYTREYCESECISNFTMFMCGCVQLGMPRKIHEKICSRGSNDCVSEALSYMYAKGLVDKSQKELERIGNVTESYLPYACNCLQSCTTLNYETTRLTHKMDMKTYVKLNEEEETDIEKVFNLMPGDTITKVEIYMTDSYFIMSKRSELYGVTDFLASCGGLIGVCLGFSILSLVEFIYFFTIRVFCDIRKKRNRVANKN